MAIRVVGLGAGGHARVVIEILQKDPAFEIVGLLDSDPRLKGSLVLGAPVLGDDALLPSLKRDGVGHFFIGLGAIGNLAPRRRIYELCSLQGFTPVSALHPQAIISPSATLGPGVTIMAGAILNAGATLGANVIVNTGAIVEHDCVVQDHAHIATGARLAGTVRVGRSTHIGAGATIRENVTIADEVIVGAGAVVVHDIPSGLTVVGIPARELKRR